MEESISAPKDEQEWLLEDALTYIGIGKTHYLLTFTSGLIITMAMTETLGMGYIMKSAECDLKLSAADKGLLSSMCYVGIILMAFIWGYLSDTRGRHRILKWTLLGTTVASILSSFAPNFTSFAILRFLLGVCLSATIVNTYPYLGELTPIKWRPIMMSVSSTFFGLSMFYVPLAAMLALSNDVNVSIFGLYNYHAWRLLVVLYALPGLISTIIIFFYPESPKFLMAKGNETEALNSIAWMYTKNTGNELPIKKLKEENLSMTSSSLTLVQMVTFQIFPLFKPPHVKYLIISFLIVFANYFT